MTCNNQKETEKTNAIRFRHHHLCNGGVLTVCTNVHYTYRLVNVGWALFNPSDKRWIRKQGSKIAKNRMFNNELYFTLSDCEPIICDYISLRALLLIMATSKQYNDKFLPEDHPSIIPKPTIQAIQFEVIEILDLLGQRVGIHSMYE